MTAMPEAPVALCMSSQAQQATSSTQEQPNHANNDPLLNNFLNSTKPQPDQCGENTWSYSSAHIATKTTAEGTRSRSLSNTSRSGEPLSQGHMPVFTATSTGVQHNVYPQQQRSPVLHKQQQQQQQQQQRQRYHYTVNRQDSSKQQPQSQVVDRSPSLTSTSSSVPSPVPSINSGRRSSITSVSSTISQSFSIRSGMSVNTKQSLSKRLRKVFSMSHLRSSKDSMDVPFHSNSHISHATGQTAPSVPERATQLPTRRRSFASLSSLFQKHATIDQVIPSAVSSMTHVKENQSSSGDLRKMARQKANRQRPELRVDTNPQMKGVHQGIPIDAKKSNLRGIPHETRTSKVMLTASQGSLSAGSESPNTTASSRPNGQFASHAGECFPSPSPSSSSSTFQRNMGSDDHNLDVSLSSRAVGFHFGLPLHGSPRLIPAVASSSTSSIATMSNLPMADKPRRLQFCPTVQVNETFAPHEYDRTCHPDSTCIKLSPLMAIQIKQELNEYKLTDMQVHIDSRQYTQFFM